MRLIKVKGTQVMCISREYRSKLQYPLSKFTDNNVINKKQAKMNTFKLLGLDNVEEREKERKKKH